METRVLKTANGNYVALINGIETFISNDGIRSNPVTIPCFDHLSKHNCHSFEVSATEPLVVIHQYEQAVKSANEEKIKMALQRQEELIPIIEDQRKRSEEWEAKNIQEENDLLKIGIIPTTIENLKIVMRHLNRQNWGSWTLPQMTIGYSANQYDCDGQIATTIKLNKGIEFETWDGLKKIKMFKIGGKRGHLEKYQLI